MRIGLVSDTHGDKVGWEKAQVFLKKTDLVLHAGDILNHGVFNPILDSYAPKELAQMMNDFPVPLMFARGNCDSEVDQMALENPILSEYSLVEIGGLRIIILHGHQHAEEDLFGLAKRWKVKLVVRGHTHIHSIEEAEGVVMVNPGSPSLPKGDEVPTIGLIEDGLIRIMDLDRDEEISRLEID